MPSVLVAASADELANVARPGVEAVIHLPNHRAPWEADVAAAVESSSFVVERCTLEFARPETLVHELAQRLPERGLGWETRLALIDDLAGMAERLATIASCSGIMLRLFTEVPTRHCGFHVDTAPPDCPPYGLLKVYNGSGTTYVEAADVSSVRGFYQYLGQRERWSREYGQALGAGDEVDAGRVRSELEALDRAPPFMQPGSSLHEVPAGAQVAFRLLDVRDHGSDHPRDRAWIHCSPMEGQARLVANFTPLDGLPARRR